MTKTVAIVGRVNVGKSSLFNCLTDSHDAVVSPLTGITCDRKYGRVEQEGRFFTLIDTGGVDLKSIKNSISALSGRTKRIEILSEYKGMFEQAIVQQTKVAIKEADLLLMVVDGEKGLRAEDKDLAQVLKKTKKPVLLVCNKIDLVKENPRINLDAPFLASLFDGVDKVRLMPPSEEFKELGLGEPILLSAIDGRGRDSLLELIVDTLQIEVASKTPVSAEKLFRIVMIGRSGVGKSSLFNQILGEELAVVSDIYQTTIDSNHGTLTYQDKPPHQLKDCPRDNKEAHERWCGGKSILLTDAPGLLEKSDMRTDLDKTVHQKTIDILESADAALFVTEVTKSLCSTDQYLAHLIARARVPTVVVANKWDAFPRKDREVIDQITIHYRNYLPKLGNVPIVFTSAKTGEGMQKIMDLATRSVRQGKKDAIIHRERDEPAVYADTKTSALAN